MLNRRHFLSRASALSGLAATSALTPAWARSAAALGTGVLPSLSGTDFDLTVGRTPFSVDGRASSAITVNGTVPAPLLRWREGDEVTLRVHNTLDMATSIHWHGILLPFEMDGVPGVSFPGIAPGETFTYRFPLRQSGTYWYHSHSGLQEQVGHYGPIIIDPAGSDPVSYDREYVMVLGDWTFMDPHRLFAELKKNGHSLNYNQRTLGDFFADAREDGLGAALGDRRMWGAMRMTPTDIADVTGETYAYLINGLGPDDNWTGLFQSGERIRLRIINAAAMTIFNVRIPGLPMTVVQSDGLNVQPIETDEFQIGVAETYDVVVTPDEDRAYTFVAESIDRSGMARATLAPRPGMEGEVPALRDRTLLTMADMGMAHGHGNHNSDTPEEMAPDSVESSHAGSHAAMDHGGGHRGHAGMDSTGSEAGHAMAGHGGANASPSSSPTVHDHPTGPGVANTATMPVSRLDEPGIGLEEVAHRTLRYSQLRSLAPTADHREPGREIELHLTSNMERYMWSFDGVRFSEVVDPILFHEGERVRLTMVNDTMMPHPIHLHGMFFDLVLPGSTGGHEARHWPRKHTVIVKPGERLSVDVTADEVGDWAFHCHLLYHMHAGMMQVVSVRPDPGDANPSHHSMHGDHTMTGEDM
ncbi:copper resistance system multicopper oxidase [Marinicauda sp. Alg238-R41]|uniref:copper resistance system multicopper oxidase n=1 Tax=Marinicauda sp. Alg238-R41 TaxID=2993447 RepID=UPI0022E4782A|nr:copper resistance system multicopper oxidase [Marinicauda sp. Alg238-R41]